MADKNNCMIVWGQPPNTACLQAAAHLIAPDVDGLLGQAALPVGSASSSPAGQVSRADGRLSNRGYAGRVL